MSELRAGRESYGRKPLAVLVTAGLLLTGCVSKMSGSPEGEGESLGIEAAVTEGQLLDAYASCKVSFDYEDFKVIKSDEPTSKVQYGVKAEKNADIEDSGSDVAYKGLVAEISGDDTVPAAARGTISWKDEAAGIATHELPSIDVYGPNSVAYNLFAVAEGDLDLDKPGVDQSYRYCGTVAVSGHTNEGITDVQPVEPFSSSEIPPIAIHTA